MCVCKLYVGQVLTNKGTQSLLKSTKKAINSNYGKKYCVQFSCF